MQLSKGSIGEKLAPLAKSYTAFQSFKQLSKGSSGQKQLSKGSIGQKQLSKGSSGEKLHRSFPKLKFKLQEQSYRGEKLHCFPSEKPCQASSGCTTPLFCQSCSTSPQERPSPLCASSRNSTYGSRVRPPETHW